jgi:predicted type IV restriction endonuclease
MSEFPTWLVKFAKRVATLTPGRTWLILVSIEPGQLGAKWVVTELGKVEAAQTKLDQKLHAADLNGRGPPD